MGERGAVPSSVCFVVVSSRFLIVWIFPPKRETSGSQRTSSCQFIVFLVDGATIGRDFSLLDGVTFFKSFANHSNESQVIVLNRFQLFASGKNGCISK